MAMKYLMVALLIALPLAALADNDFDIAVKGEVTIPAEARKAGVFVSFTNSASKAQEVREYLVAHGYQIADDKDKAAVELYVSGDLFIKDKGTVDLGKFSDAPESASFRPNIYRSESNKLDAGLISQGTQLTGSLLGGIAVSVFSSLIGETTGATHAVNKAFYHSAEPGQSVKVKIYAKFKSNNKEQIMDVTATSFQVDADTSALIGSAYTKALSFLD
jgi:hypothetical protein